MKVVSLVGARPQYIKEAVVSKDLERLGVDEVIVNSGQHYDFNMSDIFFKTLGIKPSKYNLKVGSGKHGEMTAKIITEFEKVLEVERPDMVLIYGDTNTTLAGAVVASKMRVLLGHVEAGVRMNIKNMPEEVNRILADHSSDYLFTATESCVSNLKNEGLVNNVYFTGDVMYDLFLKMQPSFRYDVFNTLDLKEDAYVLVTLHRDFNVDDKDRLQSILEQLTDVNKELRVVFSLHPRTKEKIKIFNFWKYLENFVVTEPLDYLNLMGLLTRSNMVITDSGGLSKEAYFAEKYCLVMMGDSTVRELLDTGYQRLCNEDNLRELVKPNGVSIYRRGLFGDGEAGKKIADIVLAAGQKV